MKKTRVKSYFTGMLTMVMMFVMVMSISGSAGQKSIDVVYNDLKLVVDGVEVELGNDTSGAAIEPFILDGTTYLPVRAVAEALGEEVGWDGETSTVFIGKRDVADEDATYIGNGIKYLDYKESYFRHSFSYSYEGEGIATDNLGAEFTRYMWLLVKDEMYESEPENCYIEFPTNGLYSSFKSTLALSLDSKTTRLNSIVEIFADGVSVGKYELKSGTLPQDIDVDINKALKVRFKVTQTDSGESGVDFITALFGNPRFIE